METNSLVVTYEYTYGAGNAPNRRLQFYGDGEKILGVVEGKSDNSWKKIGEVSERDMIVEGASTARKIEIMMEARQAHKEPEYPPDQHFDHIPYDKRLEAIQNLQPSGRYRITITNYIGADPRFEKIEKLTFFDPS